MKLDAVPWYWSDGELFRGVDASSYRSIIDDAVPVTFGKGQKIFGELDLADRVFILKSGLVKIFHLSKGGSTTIFWFCGRGALFGAGGISGFPRQAVSAQAVKISEVLTLSRPTFERLLFENPRIGLNVIWMLGARLRIACDTAVQRHSVSVRGRIARLLLQILYCHYPAACEREGLTALMHDIDITQQDLADMLGVARQTINKELSSLRQLGIVSITRAHIQISDVRALREAIV